MKLIIAGSRTVSPTIADIDREMVTVLHRIGLTLCADRDYKDAVTEVISGDANGADMAGAEWAKARGIPVHLDPVTPRDYAEHGKYLGPRRRNRRMAERGDALLAFWDGVSGGTADMVTRMLARGKPAFVVPYKPRAKPTRRIARGADMRRSEDS